MKTFEKQPFEEQTHAFNYYGVLPPFDPQVTFASGTVSAQEYDAATGTSGPDAPDVLITPDMTGFQKYHARFGVKGGEAGKTYKITAQTIWTDGTKLEDEVLMKVVDL